MSTRLLLALAALCLMANGAQAHMGVMASGSETVLICGPGTTQTLTLATGEMLPATTDAQTRCGDCTAIDAMFIRPSDFKYARLDRPMPRPLTAVSIAHPGSPLWPGAPPQGPPAAASRG